MWTGLDINELESVDFVAGVITPTYSATGKGKSADVVFLVLIFWCISDQFTCLSPSLNSVLKLETGMKA